MKITNNSLPFAAQAMIKTDNPDRVQNSIVPFFSNDINKVFYFKYNDALVITASDVLLAKGLTDIAAEGLIEESNDNILKQMLYPKRDFIKLHEANVPTSPLEKVKNKVINLRDLKKP